MSELGSSCSCRENPAVGTLGVITLSRFCDKTREALAKAHDSAFHNAECCRATALSGLAERSIDDGTPDARAFPPDDVEVKGGCHNGTL
jgi:hypothetical protein